MVGYRSTAGYYYLCGSHSYRRGLGCGPGVYVRQAEVEAQVIEDVRELVGRCGDPKGFARQVNERLRKLWEASTGHDAKAARQLDDIDQKIANIRRAIADGLDDVAWANEELRALRAKREQLAKVVTPAGKPPQVDAKTAVAYRKRMEETLRKASVAARRALIRECVQEMKLLPEDLEVVIDYALPAPLMRIGSGSLDAGAYRDRPGSGGWIRTSDLRVMSPTSFLTAPPRNP